MKVKHLHYMCMYFVQCEGAESVGSRMGRWAMGREGVGRVGISSGPLIDLVVGVEAR